MKKTVAFLSEYFNVVMLAAVLSMVFVVAGVAHIMDTGPISAVSPEEPFVQLQLAVAPVVVQREIPALLDSIGGPDGPERLFRSAVERRDTLVTRAAIDAAWDASFEAEDQQLFLAVAFYESTLFSKAVGDDGAALGLTQIQPQWWMAHLRDDGIIRDTTDLLDPAANARAFTSVMAALRNRHGSDEFALRSYHRGDSAVQPGSNVEADRYARKILRMKAEIS